jgi:hypothetical protein
MNTPTQFTDIHPDSAIHHASSLTVGLIEYLAGEFGSPLRVIGPSNLKVCSVPATAIPAVIIFPLRMNGQAVDASSWRARSGRAHAHTRSGKRMASRRAAE